MLRTTRQVADELGLTAVSVGQMLKRLNAPKLGNQYIIDDELFAEVKRRHEKGAGRPRKGEQP